MFFEYKKVRYLSLNNVYLMNVVYLISKKHKFLAILNKKHQVLSVLFVLTATLLFGQDPEFTQFYASPLHLNPALAGTGKCSRITSTYRNQWPSIQNAYVTYQASFDQYLKNMNGGVGLAFIGDRAADGIYNTMGVSGTYAYRINFDSDFQLQAGLQFAYYQKSLNWARLQFGDEFHPIYGYQGQVSLDRNANNRDKVGYSDYAVGLLGLHKSFYAGVAVKHITEPNESFNTNTLSKLPTRFTLHGGGIVYLVDRYSEKMILAPEFLYSQQGRFKQLNLGVYWSNQLIVAGVWARHTFGNSDAVIPYVGYRKDFFKIAYSYDVTISNLGVQRTAGAHEISLEFTFCSKNDQQDLVCPRFY